MLQYTVQKMKFSITDFFSKCDQICSFLRIWSSLLKKSLMVGLIFSCSVKFCKNMLLKCFRFNSFIVKSLLLHRKSSEFVFYSPQIFVSSVDFCVCLFTFSCIILNKTFWKASIVLYCFWKSIIHILYPYAIDIKAMFAEYIIHESTKIISPSWLKLSRRGIATDNNIVVVNIARKM